MRTPNHRPKILTKIWLTVAVLAVLFAAFGLYVRAEKKIDRAHDLRHNSYQIANQMRQSAEDLSFMARSYVATGDARYRLHYQDILDIRDGRKPRPAGYFDSYWSQVLADRQPPSAGGGLSVSLLDLARQSGFSAAELEKLAAAKTKSDALTALEREAMRLADASGAGAEAQRARARLMLHEAEYLRAKAGVMALIDDCYRLMDQRTLANVRAEEANALHFRLLVIAVALATAAMLWRSYSALLNALGGPDEEVRAQMARIGRGDFSTPITVAPGREDSVLAGLLDMQNKLHQLQIERDRAEESLRASTERLNEAQRIAHLGSWHLDLASGKLLWSDEVYHLFEVDPQRFDATYDAFLGLVHPEDRAAVNAAYSESLAHRTSYEITHRLLMGDGRVKWVQERGSSEFGPDGKPLRSTGTVQDITEKKLAENLLHKREEEFRALVENSPDIICRIDKDLRCAYANPAFQAAVGLNAEAIAGKTAEQMNLPGEVAALWRASLRRVISAMLPDTFDFSLESAGSRHFQVRTVPEFGSDGAVQSVLVVGRDISAITRGVEVLRESEERLHAITANTPGLVFQCMLPGAGGNPVFTYVSDGSLALLGLSAAQVQAQRGALAQAILEPDRDAFRQSMLDSARAMAMWNWEGRILLADGTEKWINCRATPRPGGGGAVIWEGVMLNVTDSKRAEEELRNSRHTLRELLAHRESVKEDERKRIAREVHDELGQALTVLRMDVWLLRLNFGAQSPQLMARIEAMKDVVDRLIGIARHITSTLRPTALDLGLTAAIEWLVEDFIDRTGIRCELDTANVEVVLDDTRATALFRIVQESMTNVMKHAEASEVRIVIRADEREVRVEVRDDGKGFARDHAAKTGSFGLVGIRERASMLGGEAEIHSAPGAGTRVSVRIPLA